MLYRVGEEASVPQDVETLRQEGGWAGNGKDVWPMQQTFVLCPVLPPCVVEGILLKILRPPQNKKENLPYNHNG